VNIKSFSLFFLCTFSLAAFAKEQPIKLEDEVRVLAEVQKALLNSNCSMDLSVTKNNAFLKIHKNSKQEAMNLQEHLTTKSISEKDGVETLRYETNWSPSGVLFAEIEYRTRLSITKTDGQITKVTLKSRDMGYTIYYPILRYSKVSCDLN
jgi:hypothetical protein